MYERRAYISRDHRNELAKEVLRLGYDIESQRNTKGVDNGFEIKGISKDVLPVLHSSEERDKSIRQFATEHGRQPTDNEVAILCGNLGRISCMKLARRRFTGYR